MLAAMMQLLETAKGGGAWQMTFKQEHCVLKTFPIVPFSDKKHPICDFSCNQMPLIDKITEIDSYVRTIF